MDLEALELQIDGDQLPDDVVVVDHEHPRPPQGVGGRAQVNGVVGRRWRYGGHTPQGTPAQTRARPLPRNWYSSHRCRPRSSGDRAPPSGGGGVGSNPTGGTFTYGALIVLTCTDFFALMSR